MILNKLSNASIKFGKLVRNNKKLLFSWKKKIIFFELPYWKHNVIRHNLDSMHIEKNVCDNIIGTLLNGDKSKDNVKSRLDFVEIGIRPELHPIQRTN